MQILVTATVCSFQNYLFSTKTDNSQEFEMSSSRNTFFYFAYGSNLLTQRIHIQNPTATRKHIAELRDHRLDFIGFTKRWGGAPATIVPSPGDSVWGAVWEIDLEHLEHLDDQEGVHVNVYFPKEVEVTLSDGETLICRIYQRTSIPPIDHHEYPYEKPSPLYREIIIRGAIESNLPDLYLEKLKSLPHNGCDDAHMKEKLINIQYEL